MNDPNRLKLTDGDVGALRVHCARRGVLTLEVFEGADEADPVVEAQLTLREVAGLIGQLEALRYDARVTGRRRTAEEGDA